jgi:hypothetical protein
MKQAWAPKRAHENPDDSNNDETLSIKVITHNDQPSHHCACSLTLSCISDTTVCSDATDATDALSLQPNPTALTLRLLTDATDAAPRNALPSNHHNFSLCVSLPPLTRSTLTLLTQHADTTEGGCALQRLTTQS